MKKYPCWTFNIVTADATECVGLGNGTSAPSSVGTTAGVATSFPTVPANLSVCVLSPLGSQLDQVGVFFQSPSSKSHIGAIAGGVVGGLIAYLLVVAGTVMYNRRRNVMRRMTKRFVIKKWLVLGRSVDSKDVVRDD